MLLSHIKRLCTILPSLIAASPQNTDPNSAISTSLPVQLQRTVPACAQPCLQSALDSTFPSCTFQEDLSCFCSRYSNSGQSLGEVALGCIYSSCSTIDKASSTYNICLGQKDAVRPTQTAITVIATMASSTPSTTVRQTSTFATSTQPTATPSGSIDINSFPSSTSTLFPTSLSPTESPTAVPVVAASPPGPKTMKPAQIAGLSVAAAATFIVAIGLMALSVFLRRRRERKEMSEVAEKKVQLPRVYSSRYSQYPPRGSSLRVPPSRFPLPPKLSTQNSRESLRNLPQKKLNPKSLPRQANPNTIVYAVAPTSSPPRTYPPDLSSIHPLLRPGAGSRNSSNSSVPLDQIGLAISAELPGKSTKVQSPQPPRKAELKQQRAKSLRRSMRISNRISRASVLTQDTVFEEDVLPARRRSSKLLPTPPIPIMPIRALQPSRPAQTFNPSGSPQPSRQIRQQVSQQPELFLSIPVRHSRTLPPSIIVPEGSHRSSPKQKPQLASPINIASTYSAYQPIVTTASTPEPNNVEDIPDYYFTSHPTQKSSQILPPGSSFVRPQGSPKVVNIKPKNSASTVSRATSRASTTFRDSISSQTSFETTGTNDPTPDDEDDDKQLSNDNKLSPVAESPISNLRYPKVPRASNQLVPRSPRSPQSQKGQNQLQALSKGGSRAPSPSALLVKRRGEREALELESQLHVSSPSRTEVRDYMKQHRQHMRSNSVVDSWNTRPTVLSERSVRAQSGQWPKSPAMYETGIVKPLNIRAKRQSDIEMEALKSPAWVPHLTPTRHGKDLLISVTYSKDVHR